MRIHALSLIFVLLISWFYISTYSLPAGGVVISAVYGFLLGTLITTQGIGKGWSLKGKLIFLTFFSSTFVLIYTAEYVGVRAALEIAKMVAA